MTTFSTFAELAAFAGIKVKGNKKIKTQLPENSFLHVKEIAGKPAAVMWIALNDRAASKKSGPDGYPLMTVDEIVNETGFEADDVMTGIIRLAKNGLLTKITPEGLIAA